VVWVQTFWHKVKHSCEWKESEASFLRWQNTKSMGMSWIQIQLLSPYKYLNLLISAPWSLTSPYPIHLHSLIPYPTPNPTHLHPLDLIQLHPLYLSCTAMHWGASGGFRWSRVSLKTIRAPTRSCMKFHVRAAYSVRALKQSNVTSSLVGNSTHYTQMTPREVELDFTLHPWLSNHVIQ